MKAIVLVLVSACAHAPPPRAVVSPFEAATARAGAVLVTPTICLSSEEVLCNPAAVFFDVPVHILRFDQYVDPMMHLKLQLAGYVLAEAATMRLVTAERVDTTIDSSPSSRISAGPTVADLAPPDRIAAATAFGLAGVLSSELHVVREGTSPGDPIRMDLVVELIGLPDQAVRWKVTCSEPFENWRGTLRLLGDCVGNGILAWRAPDTIIRSTRSR